MAEQLARILYIDDDPGIRRLVQKRLVGAIVTLASSGQEGLALVRGQTFDAIALDHSMPGQDGLEVLALLREMPDGPPVVFVTASEEPRVAIAALKAGAVDYVVKDASASFVALLGPILRGAIDVTQARRAREAAERDVRESNARLERLAAQQAVLLREVNHRVSNSLQLISSLIDLQARRVADPQARDLLRRASERVEAVALVHRRLYTSNDVSHVDMDQYLHGMVEEFRRAMEAEDGPARLQLVVEPMRLETDKAVSVGLIVNELVTNAVKYAYPNGAQGVVRIALARRGATGLALSVEDDGIGHPEAGEAAKGSGVGAMIVKAMAETLGARITIDRAWRGTRIVVEMNAARADAAGADVNPNDADRAGQQTAQAGRAALGSVA